MKILLQNILIIDPNSPYNNQHTDVLIEKGMIAQIGKFISASDAIVISGTNYHVSPGWMDLHAHLRDPGFEFKETIESGANAAAKGGFTAVLAMPDTLPVVQTKSAVEYIIKRSEQLPVDIIPAGALTQDLKGKEMAELYDMHLAGAKAFTDAEHPVHHGGLLVRALMYANNFGGKIHLRSDEETVSQGGQMHEGIMSTMLGLKGIPALAEELMIARNIYLAEYAGAPIHLMGVSTEKSVQLIREAKSKGLEVTAAVHAYNLFWNDSVLEDFDTNYKVNPPLRGENDRKALLDAVADGTIDCITSGHSPEDIENKVVEFDLAAFGITGLESAFALACSSDKFSAEQLVNALSIQPRKITDMVIPVIKAGEKANLTVFDPTAKWTFTLKDIYSKSKNTPLVGKELTGKVIGIYNKGQWVINN
ncbi:MAG: dihydroorotase [Bacteroidetes bacterium]|nr:dihydroorotase [Bacteroidota bacterium]